VLWLKVEKHLKISLNAPLGAMPKVMAASPVVVVASGGDIGHLQTPGHATTMDALAEFKPTSFDKSHDRRRCFHAEKQVEVGAVDDGHGCRSFVAGFA
jgi:hypothetical protein